MNSHMLFKKETIYLEMASSAQYAYYEHCLRCPCEMKIELNIGSSGDTKAVLPFLNLLLIIFRGNID